MVGVLANNEQKKKSILFYQIILPRSTDANFCGSREFGFSLNVLSGTRNLLGFLQFQFANVDD